MATSRFLPKEDPHEVQTFPRAVDPVVDRSAARLVDIGGIGDDDEPCTPSLTAKVLVTVPVTVSCSPFDPSLTPTSASASISIEQATGKAIARGTGSLSSFYPAPLLFPCDSAEHTVAVDVLADAAGSPFRRGDAVFRGFASAGAAQQCGPSCFFDGASQSASVGPAAIKIR